MYGLKLDMDNTTATNGTNIMYGLHVTPMLTHASNAGSSFVYGAHIAAQGGSNGSSFVQGARIEAAGGDINYGLQLDVEDGGVDLRIESSVDNGDYFQIQTTTHGATTITTVDDDASAANLTLDIDGKIIIEAVAGDEVVFNEGSADVDFRVETNATATAFVIDGGDDLVKIDAAQALHFKDLGGAANTPASGYGVVYVNSDALYFKKDDGTAINMIESGGGSLDDAYDLVSPGNGAVITVDNQPIQFKVAGASSIALAITGSVIIGSGSNGLLPAMPGNDTNFFVSGSIGSASTAEKGTTVLGGDVVVSGSLIAQTGFKTTTTYFYALAGGTVANGTNQYISFKNTGQSTNGFVAGHYFHAPASGSLERIAFSETQSSPGAGSGKITFCMFTNNMSDGPDDESPLGHVTASIDESYTYIDDGASQTGYKKMVDFSGTRLTLSGSNIFNPGDIIKISAKGDGRIYTNATMTFVFKLNEVDPIF